MVGYLRIVICDDHKIIREGLKSLLEFDGDIKVVGEAADGDECVRLCKVLRPDVLLLDINMPKVNGLEVLRRFKESRFRQKVLVLTIHDEVDYLMKAMEIGSCGYVLKDTDSSTIKEAINTVYNGGSYIDASLIPTMKEFMNKKKKPSLEVKLTKREIQILRLLSEGLFNKEIGGRLGISEKTVRNHISHLFKTIGVSDRTQAAVYAIKNNIVDIL